MSDNDQAAVRVRCACGWETSGPVADVVVATQEHGQRTHNMLPTREQVLEMIVTDHPQGS